MKTALSTFLIAIGLLSMAQEGSSQLTVRVENIRSQKGNVRIGLFNEESSFLNDALRGVDIKVKGNILAHTFTELNTGFYAVSIYHDKNENGELDTNFIGIPDEPYGFSNNAKGMFGPPGFEDCKFKIDKDQKTISIKF